MNSYSYGNMNSRKKGDSLVIEEFHQPKGLRQCCVKALKFFITCLMSVLKIWRRKISQLGILIVNDKLFTPHFVHDRDVIAENKEKIHYIQRKKTKNSKNGD